MLTTSIYHMNSKTFTASFHEEINVRNTPIKQRIVAAQYYLCTCAPLYRSITEQTVVKNVVTVNLNILILYKQRIV